MPPELKEIKGAIDEALLRFLPDRSSIAQKLVDAMRYAALGYGKRLRPLLTCTACRAFGGEMETALAPACAVELIHAYSLVHDDLPALDNDSLRRGRPSCHIAYGEADAILAGNALLALGFEILAKDDSAAVGTRLAGIGILAEACGWRQMIGGQSFDIASVGRQLELDDIKAMHNAKTGALISAAVRLGALFAEADQQALTLAEEFGGRIGLAFQIMDDVLDVSGDEAVLGKPVGADERADRRTFATIMGPDKARSWARALLADANAMLAHAGLEDTALAQIGALAVNRSH